MRDDDFVIESKRVAFEMTLEYLSFDANDESL